MNPRYSLIVVAALAFAGCTVGTDFKRPDTPPVQWHTPLPHGGKMESLDKWWQQLNDPLLSELIVDTEKNSPTLDMALAKMNEARANATISGADLYPSLSLTAGSTTSRNAFGTYVFQQTVNNAGFDASWEID